MAQTLKADGLIFDVDGVLIDTSHSFLPLISLAVAKGWSSILGNESSEAMDLTEWVKAAKGHSHYNDDYHIVTCLLATASHRGGPLVQALPSLEEWRLLLERAGSEGPAAFHRENRASFSEETRLQMRALCGEIYLGSEKEPGLWRNEKTLLHCHWRQLPLPCGIYTGRFGREVDLALDTLGWQDFPREFLITADTCHKPDPQGLEVLCRRLNVQTPLFFGDTMSDWQCLEHFGRGFFIAIGPLVKDAPHRYPHIETALSDLGLLP